ncbi:MAG: alkaline phosphatase family protein [Alphaproteobacteria bacterium]|nr:alkaline phosphatase family protein [Alphaproteobacteria bacterium]
MTHKLVYPDYENCLTNVTCSIMKHFGLEPPHKTLPFVDALLAKNYENVIMMVFDGMGEVIVKNNLPADSFLVTHIEHCVTSVFPSTTTAATSSLRTGLNPCEHGRVGYHTYMQKLDKVVTLFKNVVRYTEEPAAPYNVMETLLPTEDVTSKINRAGKYKAYSFFPFGDNAYEDLAAMGEGIQKLCRQAGKKYIYAYHIEPDSTMHDKGTDAPEAVAWMEKINSFVEDLAPKLHNTLIIILADHGHLNSKETDIKEDYPDLAALIEFTSMESRACAFHVKPENRQAFAEKFAQLFGRDYILMTKEEVLKSGLFGDGEPCANFEASLGDYLAIAVSDKYLEYQKRDEPMLSHHAGLVYDEMSVPLIIVEK